MKRTIVFITFVLIACLPLAAAPGDTQFNLNLGVDYNFSDEGENTANIIGVSVMPDISIGKVGVGLSGTLRFDMTDGFAFMSEDWVPDYSEDGNFIEKVQTTTTLYLPIFRYVRYGWKGDPIYARLGELDSSLIGTGIFVDGYTNTALQPDVRLRGVEFDLDGRLFGFPYIGMESFVNDLSLMDVFSVRLYGRPMAFLEIPIIKDIQIGAHAAVDRAPDTYSDEFTTAPEQVQMYGADIMMPLLNTSLFSATLFNDLAFQGSPRPEPVKAFRTGLRGRALAFFDYIVDATFPLDDGFVPNYITKDYDTERFDKYQLQVNPGPDEILRSSEIYLHGGTGFSFMEDNLMFDLSVDGTVADSGSITDPSMTAHLKLGEDLLPMFYFDAYYTKSMAPGGELEDFISEVMNPTENAEVVADVTVTYSMLKTTFGITVNYDENGDRTSSVTVAGNLDVTSMLPFL